MTTSQLRQARIVSIVDMITDKVVTAATIAKSFKVSDRTIHRYMHELKLSGHAVEGVAGLGFTIRSRRSARDRQEAAGRDDHCDIVKGRLHYLSWDRPWVLIADDGQLVDISPAFWDFAAANKGSAAALNSTLDRIDLLIDPSEPLSIDFDNRGAGIILTNDAGFKNVAAYLAMAMERFNGRQVEMNLSSTSFALVTDPSEPVPEVFYKIEGGNDGRIPEGEERTRCRIGQGSECCIFVLFNSPEFECGKFGTFSRVLLDRHANSRMKAGRIGNCRLAGREKANG